jgi:hypothetical protein
MQHGEVKKELERAIKAKEQRADPYERVLDAMGYYVASKRIQVDGYGLSRWPPPCAKWEVHKDATVQLYAVDEWKVLDWFVQLVKKGELEDLTLGVRLQLQEQYRALQARGIPYLTKGPCWNRKTFPSLEELKDVQRAVRVHVNTFLETKIFTFTEFTPTLLIQRDPDDPRRLVDHEFVPHLDVKGMLYLFATLLRRVRVPIERCPQCQHIFLKPRRDAEHCSRECQYLHYAQKKRGHRPPGKRGRPRKHPDPQLPLDKKVTKKEGAKSHGLKKTR